MVVPPDFPAVPVGEYLSTVYDPDLEYVDGVLVERSAGDWLHALIQSNLLFRLRQKYPCLKVVAELRASVTGTRYRIPDVCVLLAAPNTRYLLDAAFLAIEVLSEGDVMSVVIEKLKEYASKDVPNIWVIDPRLRLMWVYRAPALVEIEDDAIATDDGTVSLTRNEIFAD